MALISTLHKWLGDTDGTGSTIRVLLCDYRKAFDIIDHSLLVTKLKQVDIPRSIIKWVVDHKASNWDRTVFRNGANGCFWS